MLNARDRILIVENDPLVSDLIGRQALQAAGYQPIIVSDVSSAISKAVQLAPDVIIINLNLPGLSGKDLMVALTSQGSQTPVIVLAQKGMEADIIQALRLGAADYLLWPVREAEVLNAVERVLKQVHERRERERLSRQLQQTNQELQARVRELTTIFAIGKAVTSITDQSMLFEKILEGAVRVTQADLGWFMLRDEANKSFVLAAQQGLPASISAFLNRPWDDGISSLVAMSSEPLSIHGEPLKRFKISGLGAASLIVPIKAQKQVIGLLTVMRKKAQPFSSSEQHLLEAMADYASISLVNARLFRALEERARTLQTLAETAQMGEKINHEILDTVKREMRPSVELGRASVDRLSKDPTTRWSKEQRQALTTIVDQLDILARITEHTSSYSAAPVHAAATQSDLAALARQSLARFQPVAQQHSLALNGELPGLALPVNLEAGQLTVILDGLLANTIKLCNAGGQVVLHAARSENGSVQVTVGSSGPNLDAKQAAALFEANGVRGLTQPRAIGGVGIGLPLIKEIVTKQDGKIWAESKSGQGIVIFLNLPARSPA